MATKAIGASGFDRANVTQMRYCHLCLQEYLSIAVLQNHIAKDHDLQHPSLKYVKTTQPHQAFSNEDSKIDAEKIAVHEEEIRNIYVSLAHDLKEIYLL